MKVLRAFHSKYMKIRLLENNNHYAIEQRIFNKNQWELIGYPVKTLEEGYKVFERWADEACKHIINITKLNQKGFNYD